MLSEKEIRLILHEKNQQIDFHFKQRESRREDVNVDFINSLNRDILLLRTILEESEWQKLIRAKNKKNKSIVKKYFKFWN